MKLTLLILFGVFIYLNAPDTTATAMNGTEGAVSDGFPTQRGPNPPTSERFESENRPASDSTDKPKIENKVSHVVKRMLPNNGTVENHGDNVDLMKPVGLLEKPLNEDQVNHGSIERETLDSSKTENNLEIDPAYERPTSNAQDRKVPVSGRLALNPVNANDSMIFFNILNNNSFSDVSSEPNLTSEDDESEICVESHTESDAGFVQEFLSEVISEATLTAYDENSTDSTIFTWNESSPLPVKKKSLLKALEKVTKITLPEVFKKNGVMKYSPTFLKESPNQKNVSDNQLFPTTTSVTGLMNLHSNDSADNASHNITTIKPANFVNLAKPDEMDNPEHFTNVSSIQIYSGPTTAEPVTTPNSTLNATVSEGNTQENNSTEPSGWLGKMGKWAKFSKAYTYYILGTACALTVLPTALVYWIVMGIKKRRAKRFSRLRQQTPSDVELENVGHTAPPASVADEDEIQETTYVVNNVE